MAPVTATATGVAKQTIDDPELLSLLFRLSAFDFPPSAHGITKIGQDDVDALVNELGKWPSWRFQEQADLYEWIKPLDAMDAALSFLMDTYPCLLLIDRSSKGNDYAQKGGDEGKATRPARAESCADATSVPSSVLLSVRTILRFLSNLLRNAVNKSVFNSVGEMSDLLASADDEITSLALETLAHLASPPLLHRQQAPEMQQHSTALHTAPSSDGVHGRLTALARGWGSKGSGLGLYACVTADDSIEGQNSLPRHAGEVSFEYFSAKEPTELPSASGGSDSRSSRLVSVQVSSEEMLASPPRQVEKRRRTGLTPEDSGRTRSFSSATPTKSTAELFFMCIDRAGGQDRFPPERAFSLLAEVRLARSFHSRADRVAAVKRRILALTCILHAHPSPDTLAGYFHAQPELCAELADLVRPTVSAASVSSASLRSGSLPLFPSRGDAISAIADSAEVPYEVRTLALEALTALVARRDGASGGLTNVARQANVLGELGVGKGQFFGLLPTLIRYSLASLNSFLSHDGGAAKEGEKEEVGDTVDVDPMNTDDTDALGLSLGLVFVEATNAPPLPREEQEERVLEFIDVVLTLTSAVVSVPSGTSALTDCGLIPALVSTVARDSYTAQDVGDGKQKSPFVVKDKKDGVETYMDCLLKFVSAQAIQILEGAIVTHSSALSAFHDLRGVDLLVKRLDLEIKQVQQAGEKQRQAGSEMMVTTGVEDSESNDVVMEDMEGGGGKVKTELSSTRPLTASRRVLLFSIMNCLTVVFHQQENSSSSSVTPSGGPQLRTPELTNALIDVMNHANTYGGVLAALTVTLLSDVMNADPQSVHYVHESGLATSFLHMLKGEEDVNSGDSEEPWRDPCVPPSSELIMALPNIITALALTEQGAKSVKEANPFPPLLSIFCCPKYAMPKSRCLLNEMSAIVGTGLDEIMRHVPSLGTVVMKSIVSTVRRIVAVGKQLVEDEENQDRKTEGDDAEDAEELRPEIGSNIVNTRTCLMQYTYNMGQLLEQILHNEGHSSSFVDQGGLDALFELFSLLIPSGAQFLAHLSCLSCPSFAKLTHLTNSSALTVAIKSVVAHYEPHKMMKKLMKFMDDQFDRLSSSQQELRRLTQDGTKAPDSSNDIASGIDGILESVPRAPMHTLDDTAETSAMTNALSSYLKQLVVTEWLTNVLSSTIRGACQKSHDIGTGWGRTEREWKKEIATKQFEDMVDRLSNLHRAAMLEVCRIRTEDRYESREMERRKPPDTREGNPFYPATYTLRIVCAEGAVVRNGVEIDSCATVGGLEIGEIVEAFDRCINSSGVMRYRTRSGWVSEQTRGHGREPIAEVLRVRGIRDRQSGTGGTIAEGKSKRTDCGVADLCSVSASVMARLQHSQMSFFSCLSRASILGVRSLSFSSLSFQQGTVGAHVGSIVKSLSRNILADFNVAIAKDTMVNQLTSSEPKKTQGKDSMSDARDKSAARITMYLGGMLTFFHSCLYEERRERDIVNVLLLLSLIRADESIEGSESKAALNDEANAPLPVSGIFGAIRLILRESLEDMSWYTGMEKEHASSQRMSRFISASLPPVLALLGRLMSKSLLNESQLSTSLGKMKASDLSNLLYLPNLDEGVEGGKQGVEEPFHFGRFCRSLYCKVADITLELWKDPRLSCAPAHIIHPVLSLVGDVMNGLKVSSKEGATNEAENQSGAERSSGGITIGSGSRAVVRPPPPPPPPFEPSEDTVARLTEMGFGRDHALEALETMESNQLEVAMEYCLSHPPPSPGAVERRRAARAEASRQRQADNTAATTSSTAQSGPADGSTSDPANAETSERDANDGDGAATAMDVEDGSSSGEMTEEERKQQAEKEANRISHARSRQSLESLRNQITPVALNLVEGKANKSESVSANDANSCYEIVNGEAENVTIAVCSFLLDLCQEYPHERTKIVSEALKRLKGLLSFESKRTTCRVAEGKYEQFASLCHACVIFLRALPRTRPLVLRYGLVGHVMHCIRSVTSSSRSEGGRHSDCHSNVTKWPPHWLAPALLLLDVMAQPTAVPLVEANGKDDEDVFDSSGKVPKEFTRMCAEHRRQSTLLSKTANQITSALTKQSGKAKKTEKAKEDKGEKKGDKGEKEGEKGKRSSSLKAETGDLIATTIPTYMPLMLPETSEMCMTLCLQILRRCSASSASSSAAETLQPSPLPGVAQAALLLLSRVLRSHKVALQCLRHGGAELICSLSAKSRFVGNTGVTTVILRRMLEDTATLQTLMETEIRGTVTKLAKKQSRGTSQNRATPKVTSRTFVQAMTPLICRDPLVFLKAAATSVKVEAVSSETSNAQAQVVLLSSEERAKNTKALLDYFSKVSQLGSSGNTSARSHPQSGGKQSLSSTPSHKRGRSATKGKSSHPAKTTKSKSPRRGSTSRRSLSPAKSTRKDPNASKKVITLNGTPANHVTSLLLTEMIKSVEKERLDSGVTDNAEMDPEMISFFCTVDYLEILADLVLAVPACAAAIHRYRTNGAKNTSKRYSISHALPGYPSPPNTAVNFLLHVLLPQPRVALPKAIDEQKEDTAEEQSADKKRRKLAYMKIKSVQTSARLLVALVARAGEGRKRVIVDLASALSGRERNDSVAEMDAPSTISHANEDQEMWALQSWGELCIGLAAPRSSGISQDSNSALSFEVVKLMLESGMAHAIMHALGKVKLHHPQAAATVGALLRPLEVFTRTSVTDNLQQMVEDEEKKKKSASNAEGESCSGPSSSRNLTGSQVPSQQNESAFADDAMLEDGFDADTAAQNRQNLDLDESDYEEEVEDADDETEGLGSDSDAQSWGEDDSDDVVESEDDSADEEDGESVSESEEDGSDEEVPSSEASSNENDDVQSMSEDEDNEMEEDDELEEIDEGSEDDFEIDENEEENNGDFFEGQAGDFEGDEGQLPPADADGDIEGEWTFLGNSETGGGSIQVRASRGRAPGIMVEAMIGNILRAGDLNMDTLAEIEDTLGIRISNQRGGLEQQRSGRLASTDNATSRSSRNTNIADENLRSMDRGAIGSTPSVRQVSPPDSGYALISSSGRSGNFNAMEFIYGGPAVGAGSRNYDLTSSRSSVPESNLINVPSSVDTQLFPGGPAASTHTRSPQSPHPLLCGVDLAPINSLVPNIRRPSSSRGRLGDASDWNSGGRLLSGAFLSDSGGHVIRQSRGGNRLLVESSRTAGISGSSNVFGWTDDGQPPDSETREFSIEFEQALRETIARAQASGRAEANNTTAIEESVPAGSRNGTDEQDTSGTVESQPRADASQTSAVRSGDDSTDALGPSSSTAEHQDLSASGPDAGADAETEADAGADAGVVTGAGAGADAGADAAATHSESSANEGENVASSLASGLRLSPDANSSGSSNQMAVEENLSPSDANIASNMDATTTDNISADAVSERVPVDSASAHIAPADSATSNTATVSAPEDMVAEVPSQFDNITDQGQSNETSQSAAAATASEMDTSGGGDAGNAPNAYGLVCPPGMDMEVFNSLPLEMQQEVISQHRATENVASQLDAASGLDPEALAALPEEMRREVIEQEQQERRAREREEAPADPSNAEEMDNASFVASLAPDLREEILLTADDTFLNSLPPGIIAEAQILRERRAFNYRREHQEGAVAGPSASENTRAAASSSAGDAAATNPSGAPPTSSSRKRQRLGKMKVECDRHTVVFTRTSAKEKGDIMMTPAAMETLIKLLFMLSPVRPQRLLQKLIQNLCSNSKLRRSFLTSFVALLNGDNSQARAAVQLLERENNAVNRETIEASITDEDEFPPSSLIGTVPELIEADSAPGSSLALFRQRHGSNAAAAIAANLPASARGSSQDGVPPVVARRIIDTVSFLSKNALRASLDMLSKDENMEVDETEVSVQESSTCLERILDLLNKPLYLSSSTNLEQLLTLLEGVVAPLSLIPKDGDRIADLTKTEIDAASSAGKEWVEVPRTTVSPNRLKLLCSLLRLESVKDSSFVKVNTIARRLCRVEANRHYILRELTEVAGVLSNTAVKDLTALSIRLRDAVNIHMDSAKKKGKSPTDQLLRPSAQVSLSSSSSELKLLRVLQALYLLSGESHNDGKKNDGLCVASPELTSLMQSIDFTPLWNQLTACLRLVSILEGVELQEKDEEKKDDYDEDVGDEAEHDEGNNAGDSGDTGDAGDEIPSTGGKKLQNSVVGLLTRFLPSIEAFFVVNSSAIGESKKSKSTEDESKDSKMLGGNNLVEFVAANKILLNALLRSNPTLLDKGLKAMVSVPRCRPFLDFDVKRQWFKAQVRRLRQHANRRHGSLRLHIRRKHVFEDAFHQLQLRNADEMRGRLHITFRNEEGVDAGGLSREFFAILAKEMFNPNYALFTSTEDGCTFQPNPNSNINPDHLSYFRFVGRIVGKAVLDGFLLDAHFTRSLYKHMLGVKPTHHDMEAIDPDYYKNLKMILEYNLADIGLDLTFSADDHSFGRSQTIDLIPNGRNTKVTEGNKEKYVSLVCQHRMTTSIESQIKAYLDGFHELVKPDLISIFTAKELELLISGMPDIDISDLKKNAEYHGYKGADKEIGWFWNIMFSLTRSQKAAFLQFVTGSSKVPLNGFAELQGMRGIQKFSVHKAAGSSGALMSAHTCFNALDLPVYKSEEEMREKLLYAISEGGGGFLFA